MSIGKKQIFIGLCMALIYTPITKAQDSYYQCPSFQTCLDHRAENHDNKMFVELGDSSQLGGGVGSSDGRLTVAQLGLSFPEIELNLPGLWTYYSTVPGGKGYQVNGSEYNIINTVNSPLTFDQGSTFDNVVSPDGRGLVFAGFFKSVSLQMSPRLAGVYFPGGGHTTLTYDARGNVTKTTITGTDDASEIVLEKNYDATCDTRVSCNKPNWAKDGKGLQTSYVYDNTHGGVLKVTLPAVNSVTPQTRYTYAQFQARFKNASGQIVASGKPIWLLTSESYCISSNPHSSGTGCASGATDEVVTTYDYGPTTGANNLSLRGITVVADGVTKRSCIYYDDFGNKIAETEPKAGLTSCY